MPDGEQLRLVDPAPEYADAFYDLVEDFRAAGEGERAPTQPNLGRADVAAFMQRLADEARGIGLRPGYVAQNIYWLLREDGRLLGQSSLRHILTPALEDIGGHIGYSVRPTERRKGYGTRILALTLKKARAMGLSRVLVTCNTDNVGSARIIQKNSGILASAGISPQSGKRVSRYWITL
jgi:predicted acetyltransferase